jgi:hypothetical protein
MQVCYSHRWLFKTKRRVGKAQPLLVVFHAFISFCLHGL